jgi:hypothetical protein
MMGAQAATFGGFQDNLLCWTYNMECGGSRFNTSEHGISLVLEGTYDSDAGTGGEQTWAELNLNFTSAAGEAWRPLSTVVDTTKNGGAGATNFVLAANNLDGGDVYSIQSTYPNVAFNRDASQDPLVDAGLSTYAHSVNTPSSVGFIAHRNIMTIDHPDSRPFDYTGLFTDVNFNSTGTTSTISAVHGGWFKARFTGTTVGRFTDRLTGVKSEVISTATSASTQNVVNHMYNFHAHMDLSGTNTTWADGAGLYIDTPTDPGASCYYPNVSGIHIADQGFDNAAFAGASYAMVVDSQTVTDGDEGNIAMLGVGYNKGHYVAGTTHLWQQAAGMLRVENGAPTADNDGNGVVQSSSTSSTPVVAKCGNVAVDPGSIAGVTTGTATATVTGLAANDVCTCAARTDFDDDLVQKGCLGTSNTLNLRLYNASAIAVDAASQTVDYCCFAK